MGPFHPLTCLQHFWKALFPPQHLSHLCVGMTTIAAWQQCLQGIVTLVLSNLGDCLQSMSPCDPLNSASQHLAHHPNLHPHTACILFLPTSLQMVPSQ